MAITKPFKPLENLVNRNLFFIFVATFINLKQYFNGNIHFTNRTYRYFGGCPLRYYLIARGALQTLSVRQNSRNLR